MIIHVNVFLLLSVKYIFFVVKLQKQKHKGGGKGQSLGGGGVKWQAKSVNLRNRNYVDHIWFTW